MSREIQELSKIRKILFFALVILLLYLLDIFAFIFIPLVSAGFLTLLLTPVMRWLNKKEIHSGISLAILGVLIIGILFLGVFSIKYASGEFISAGKSIWPKIEIKANSLIESVSSSLGLSESSMELKDLIGKGNLSDFFIQHFGSTFGIVRKAVTGLFITLFFLFLLLAGTLNFEKIANITSFNGKYLSLKTFLTLENNIVQFLLVKTVISFLTGVTTALVCYLFGLDFPIFWGILAFLINYIQMIGSIMAIIFMFLFSLVQFEATSTILLFTAGVAGVQILYGSILEPIFMGKSFKINTITILIMLMFWGYIWGIPGLILSVPIAAVIKVIFESFPSTKGIAKLMS